MSRHISEQYDTELRNIRDQLMAMGTLVEQQVTFAGTAFVTHDIPLADEIRETEKRLNHMELELDDQCVGIIARRQPTAGDLRQVIGVMKAITDFERIGDESDRIAKIALSISNREIPSSQYGELRNMHQKVTEQLHNALDALARTDVEIARRVISDDKPIDKLYKEIVGRCTQQMTEPHPDIEHLLAEIWVARSFERIGDHAKNVSEYVIFQVNGRDVRHKGL